MSRKRLKAKTGGSRNDEPLRAYMAPGRERKPLPAGRADGLPAIWRQKKRKSFAYTWQDIAIFGLSVDFVCNN